MFVWKQKLTERQEISKIGTLDSTARGSNRRAVGLVPFPVDPTHRELQPSGKLRYQQLLISIEGKQSTCCLKVVSPRRRARGALLVFRGRVLGCIYGRKDLETQMIGEEAFAPLLDDLSLDDSLVDTYILPEDLALAAGSLFHGTVFNQPVNQNAPETFDYVFGNLETSQMPGCIVVKNAGSDEVHAFIYMFAGSIVGVFTFAEGWLAKSYGAAIYMLQNSENPMVSASKLTASNVQQVFDLTFSLTGIERGRTYRSELTAFDL